MNPIVRSCPRNRSWGRGAHVILVNEVARGTISARLPEDTETFLDRYLEEEDLDRSTAVRNLLPEGLTRWQQERALEKLDCGEVTFRRAAEMAELSVWDFASLARERDVTWVGGDHLGNDIESL